MWSGLMCGFLSPGFSLPARQILGHTMHMQCVPHREEWLWPDSFGLEDCGQQMVKGKGMMRTYLIQSDEPVEPVQVLPPVPVRATFLSLTDSRTVYTKSITTGRELCKLTE